MDDIKEILGDEIFKQVTEKLGDKKLMIDDGKTIPYSRFQEVNEKKKSLESQLESQKENYEKQIDEINKQLSEFSELPKVTAEQKEKIKALQDGNAKMKADYEENLKKLKKDSAIETSLLKSGARNIKAVKALLDLESISLDGDNLINFNEQIESIKKENDYLFGTTEKIGGDDPPKGGNPLPKTEYETALRELEKEHAKNPNNQTAVQIIALKRKIRNEQAR